MQRIKVCLVQADRLPRSAKTCRSLGRGESIGLFLEALLLCNQNVNRNYSKCGTFSISLNVYNYYPVGPLELPTSHEPLKISLN